MIFLFILPLGATIKLSVETGVSLRLRVKRGTHAYVVPLRLSDDLFVAKSLAFAFLLPPALFAAVHLLVVRPHRLAIRELCAHSSVLLLSLLSLRLMAQANDHFLNTNGTLSVLQRTRKRSRQIRAHASSQEC